MYIFRSIYKISKSLLFTERMPLLFIIRWELRYYCDIPTSNLIPKSQLKSGYYWLKIPSNVMWVFLASTELKHWGKDKMTAYWITVSRMNLSGVETSWIEKLGLHTWPGTWIICMLLNTTGVSHKHRVLSHDFAMLYDYRNKFRPYL